jgi:chaperonin GroES
MKIRPMADKLIVRRLDSEKISPGGIVIPDTAQQKPARGKVIAAGLGKKTDQFDRDAKGNAVNLRIPMDVNEGDEILFAKYSGHEVEVKMTDGKVEYIVLNESDVLCVLEPDEPMAEYAKRVDDELKAVG